MSNEQMWGAATYQEILAYDPLVFLNYLEQYKLPMSYNVENQDEMVKAGNMLGEIADRYTVLSTLYTYAGMLKRLLSRNGKNTEYEDMIDKERALETVMKAVDMQYKALSKAISVHMDANRELYYSDSVKAKPQGKY